MFVGSTPRVFVAFFCTPGFHAQDTCQFGDLEPFWATPRLGWFPNGYIFYGVPGFFALPGPSSRD